jgi:DNA repair exonuclease SbcCD nuclease subunit
MVMMISTMKIDKPKVCVISDLHLGVHTNSTRWHEIALEWANWLCKELRRKNIKDIIFCGDWHHNRSEISVATLQISADILDIFKNFNILCVIGNHDAYYKHRVDVNSLSIYKGRKNITIIDSITQLSVFDRSLVFCPWETSVETIPECDVIFGHFEIESFKMNTYKMCEEGIKAKDLISKAPLTISGHFHTRHERKYENGTILYVGNPFQMDFGDSGNTKGYYILDLDTLEYTFHENTVSPQHNKISLSELVAQGSINHTTIDTLAGNIVKLKIDKRISQQDLAFLTEKLSQYKPDTLSIENDIEFCYDGAMNDVDLSGIDIEQAIEEFISMIDIQDKETILNYTLELYKKSKQ